LSKLKLQELDLASKAKAIQVQAAAAAKLSQEKLHAVLKEGVEVAAKLVEAEQELAAVKVDLAAGQQPAQEGRAAGYPTLGPELIAGVCGYLASSVPGFQLNEQFMVEIAKFLIPVSLHAAPAAAPAAPAAAPPAVQPAAPAAPPAASAATAAAAAATAAAGGPGTAAEATLPVSQVGAWAARELAAQELARLSFELLVSRFQAQAAAASVATQPAQQAGPGAGEGVAGMSHALVVAGPLTTANVERLGGTSSGRVRSSSRSERERRRLCRSEAANLSDAQQLALFSGGN
jgi:hypothetical protein